MKSIQALREERANLAKEMRALVEKEGDFTPEDDARFKELNNKVEKLDEQLERAQKVLDLEAQNMAAVRRRADSGGTSEDEAHKNLEMEKGIFNTWLREGVSALDTDQQTYIRNRARTVRNTLSTGTPAEGGYLVPQEFAATLIEALKAFGGIRSVANVMQTSTGASMDWPTTDATSEEGELVGENAAVTDEDFTFGIKSLDTYKFSSKAVAVPFELLMDSAIDIEAHIRNRLTERLGRITNRMLTTGTGVSQPTGVVTASGAGKVGAAGQVTTVTYDDLVDLQHSVDPAYRMGPRVAFMFHDQTLKALKKLKDADGRPLWLPGIDVKEPDTILGQRYVINQNMDQMAANAKSILFGDFNRYVVRDVMQFMLFRMTDSAYTKLGQVGFLAFTRNGGNLIDVGGAIKHYQNAAV